MLITLYKVAKIILAVPLAALGMPPHACRFTPSCSQYTKAAIKKYGLLSGTFLGLKRILRCRPGSPPGHDPLPA